MQAPRVSPVPTLLQGVVYLEHEPSNIEFLDLPGITLLRTAATKRRRVKETLKGL